MHAAVQESQAGLNGMSRGIDSTGVIRDTRFVETIWMLASSAQRTRLPLRWCLLVLRTGYGKPFLEPPALKLAPASALRGLPQLACAAAGLSTCSAPDDEKRNI